MVIPTTQMLAGAWHGRGSGCAGHALAVMTIADTGVYAGTRFLEVGDKPFQGAIVVVDPRRVRYQGRLGNGTVRLVQRGDGQVLRFVRTAEEEAPASAVRPDDENRSAGRSGAGSGAGVNGGARRLGSGACGRGLRPAAEGARHHLADPVAPERLGHDVIDTPALGVHGIDAVAPAGHHRHRRTRADLLDDSRDLPARDPRHPEVGDDEIERFLFHAGDAGLAVGAVHDLVAVAGQGILEHVAHLALVVDDEDPALAAGLADRPGHRLHHRLSGRRELDDERRALAELALDVELRVVAGHDAVDDAETKAGAALALGGEERIEDALAYVFGHADAGVAYAAQDVRAVHGRAERQRTAPGAGVRRGSHDVGERLAQLGGIARDDGSRPQLGHDLVLQAPRLGVVLPP